jgi:hypothetical protein
LERVRRVRVVLVVRIDVAFAVVGSVSDITERKQLEFELRQAQVAAEAANLTKPPHDFERLRHMGFLWGSRTHSSIAATMDEASTSVHARSSL